MTQSTSPLAKDILDTILFNIRESRGDYYTLGEVVIHATDDGLIEVSRDNEDKPPLRFRVSVEELP